MALLSLNDEGRSCLTSTVQNQTAEIPFIKDVLLLIDTSGSMTGDKIFQAKNGAVDFSKLGGLNLPIPRSVDRNGRTLATMAEKGLHDALRHEFRGS